MNLQQIEEQPIKAITLQVYHRYLKVPLMHYFDTVEDFPNPWDELAYQHFANLYLEQIADTGIVGMVRQEHDAEFVYFDAAIRYPAESPENSDPFLKSP